MRPRRPPAVARSSPAAAGETGSFCPALGRILSADDRPARQSVQATTEDEADSPERHPVGGAALRSESSRPGLAPCPSRKTPTVRGTGDARLKAQDTPATSPAGEAGSAPRVRAQGTRSLSPQGRLLRPPAESLVSLASFGLDYLNLRCRPRRWAQRTAPAASHAGPQRAAPCPRAPWPFQGGPGEGLFAGGLLIYRETALLSGSSSIEGEEKKSTTGFRTGPFCLC